ncbi:hypothetical protein LJC14_01120 [Treponema sp. OttesenSCG-928-L16]|nr:hypothetical protein [Treponema sp. OttesenSCG-928-L16]
MTKHILIGLVCLLLSAAVLAPMLVPGCPWPEAVRDMLSRRGYEETGAPNLVASIYLGYRAFDTLGETVVLLAALAAAMGLIKESRSGSSSGSTSDILQGNAASAEKEVRQQHHTDIIDVTAGKLAPIVLLFGWYVMFYGHQSPGGGFQGGVVLASGIVFIALGRREGGAGRLDERKTKLGPLTLNWLEVIAFAMILALCFAGLFTGVSLLENPIAPASSVPAVAYIVAFNAAIGLKVGSGIALICLMVMDNTND